jgi:SMC interacting uncharacterized protein involved in chromosome segregation
MDPTAIIVAAIGALTSVAAAYGTARAASRGARATENVAIRQIEADATKRAREVYEGALDRMQREIDRQAAQINALQLQVVRLTRQVRAAGLVPVTSSEEDVP